VNTQKTNLYLKSSKKFTLSADRFALENQGLIALNTHKPVVFKLWPRFKLAAGTALLSCKIFKRRLSQ
jgi:hypothetical protein